jgi:hypothetical protein
MACLGRYTLPLARPDKSYSILANITNLECLLLGASHARDMPALVESEGFHTDTST